MPNGLTPNLTHGLTALIGRADLLDQQVDVVAPPVGLVGEAPAVRGEGGVVGEVLAGGRVRVEVVVEVHAVDVVPRDRVQHRGLHELADLGDAGVVVEPGPAALTG